MLRAVSAIYMESQALEMFAARRELFKVLRTGIWNTYSTTASNNNQTVLSETSPPITASGAPPPNAGAPPPNPPPPPPPGAGFPPPRQRWTTGAAALAATASLGGGMYYYHKFIGYEEEKPTEAPLVAESPPAPAPVPASGAGLPSRVQYLIVGGGTAAFAAMRAIRANHPDSQVLMVSEENIVPYMRPPLSKEVWREEALGVSDPATLTFRQWNGKRRTLAYEPPAFYTPPEKLEEDRGAALARGWKVVELNTERRVAVLTAPGQEGVEVEYEKCLIATGSRPRQSAALAGARAGGRALALRGAGDAGALARAASGKRVAVVGGGLLGAELAAALASRPQPSPVSLLVQGPQPLHELLPPYLARDAARTLRDQGVEVITNVEVVDSAVDKSGVVMRLADGGEMRADIVVECVGEVPNVEIGAAAGLETDPQRGGLVVNGELSAAARVWAAGDVASYWAAGERRRLTRHDHAVASGRRAGENMSKPEPANYTHQPMFWSDLGPQRGYEAIGTIDSSLQTVGVFASEAVRDAAITQSTENGTQEAQRETLSTQSSTASTPSNTVSTLTGTVAMQQAQNDTEATQNESMTTGDKEFVRGVVFYLKEKKVVGVLLWNLFNRMHVARQVLAQGEFDDLFEVAKLFAPHEDD